MGRQGLLRLAAIFLGTSLVPLDSAVNVAFPAIVAAFGVEVPAIQWVVICYVLTYGSLMLAVGRLGDIVGHARVFQIGLAWSAVALVICATAQTFGMLLAARILQGIGAALIVGCGPALATTLFDEALRARALAAYAAGFAAAQAIGPLLGGVLVQGFGWEAVYWMRVPVALAALLLARRLPAMPVPDRREPFDALGALLLTAAVATLLLAVNRAPASASLVLAIVALACMAGFLWRSARAPRAIIDLGLFQRPGFAALNVANAMVSFAVFAVMLVGPFYLARIAGLPPLLLGLVLAVGHGAAMLGATVAGQVIARVCALLLVRAGAVMAAGGLFGVVMWEAETPLPLLMLTLAVQGFGAGLFALAYADVVTATMRREDRGVAGSLTMLTRTLGVVASASLLTLLFGTSEAALLAGGAPATDAFLGAFAWVFVVAGTLPLLALPLLRARRT